MCISMLRIKSYPTINRELYDLNSCLDELKTYYINCPSQYILYRINNVKKQINILTKHKNIRRKELINIFFKKYYSN